MGRNRYFLSNMNWPNEFWLKKTDGEMNKHRTFTSAEDFAAAKPYGAEGNFVCKYVKTGAYNTAADDPDKTTVEDYYQKLTVECRPYEDLTITSYVAGDDTGYYQML